LTPEGVERLTARADVRPVDVVATSRPFFSRFPLPLAGLPPGPFTTRVPCAGCPGAPGVLPGTLRGGPPHPAAPVETGTTERADRYIFAVLHAGCCAT
jgi:hypothetical protein